MEVAQDFSKDTQRKTIASQESSNAYSSTENGATRRKGSVSEKLINLQTRMVTRLTTPEREFFQTMGGFVDSYHDIFLFSREKIEQELHVILDFYLNDLDNFDVMNIDLVDNAKTFVERKTKRDIFLKKLDPEHRRVVEEILENHRKHRRNLLSKEEDVMSDVEKEVKSLIDKYKIIINRRE